MVNGSSSITGNINVKAICRNNKKQDSEYLDEHFVFAYNSRNQIHCKLFQSIYTDIEITASSSLISPVVAAYYIKHLIQSVLSSNVQIRNTDKISHKRPIAI